MRIKPFASPRQGGRDRAAACRDLVGISWIVFAETAVKKKKKSCSTEEKNK